MVRIILGLLKGAIVGVGVGFAATKVGIAGGALGYVTYGLVGALVGIVCGKPIWRQETLWTPVLKGVVGFLIGMGLNWGARKILGGASPPLDLAFVPRGAALVDVPLLLAPLIGVVYGIFVEVDDGGAAARQAAAAAAAPARGPAKGE